MKNNRPDIKKQTSTEIPFVIVKGADNHVRSQKKRRSLTLDVHLEHYDDLLRIVEGGIESHAEGKNFGIRKLKHVRKRLKDLRKEVLRLKVKTPSDNKISGLKLPCKISKELSEFLMVSEGTRLSRYEIINALCVYIRIKPGESRETMKRWFYLNKEGRDLQHNEKKTRICPDEKLASLIDFEGYKKRVMEGKEIKTNTDKKTGRKTKVVVTEPHLYYWILPKLIGKHIVETISRDPI